MKRMMDHFPKEFFGHSFKVHGIPMRFVHVVTGPNLWIKFAPGYCLFRISLQVHTVGRFKAEQTEYLPIQAEYDSIVSKWHIFCRKGKRKTFPSDPFHIHGPFLVYGKGKTLT